MFKFVKNQLPATADRQLDLMTKDKIEVARHFHQSFPQYTVTPLARLTNFADSVHLGGLYVKDESYRFGLNAFKVLGGSYAIANDIAQKMKRPIAQVDYQYLMTASSRGKLPETTYYTATDGNHGRGVAWAAKVLGQKAVILMPKGTQLIRYQNIKTEGADVSIQDVNYDDCVRQANQLAQHATNGVMVQDTAWPGYEQIPGWIMQGYGTMALEAAEQLAAAGIKRPTHIVIQAGVGSLASAVIGLFANLFPENPPIMIVAEAKNAACLYRTAKANDGELHFATGDLKTIMAGLACGEPNTIAFDILQNHVNYFFSCDDDVTRTGMRVLGNPLKGDPQVISGESGALGAGLVATLMRNEKYADIRKVLKLDKYAQVLVFSTEGDTDPENYRRVVWGE